MQPPLQYAAGVVEPVLGAAAGLGRWVGGGAVLLLSEVFKVRRRHHSVTTVQRAQTVCVWQVTGMP